MRQGQESAPPRPAQPGRLVKTLFSRMQYLRHKPGAALERRMTRGVQQWLICCRPGKKGAPPTLLHGRCASRGGLYVDTPLLHARVVRSPLFLRRLGCSAVGRLASSPGPRLGPNEEKRVSRGGAGVVYEGQVAGAAAVAIDGVTVAAPQLFARHSARVWRRVAPCGAARGPVARRGGWPCRPR